MLSTLNQAAVLCTKQIRPQACPVILDSINRVCLRSLSGSSLFHNGGQLEKSLPQYSSEGRLSTNTNILCIARVPYFNQPLPRKIITREIGFYSKVTAEQLWKGVTSVSKAGGKKGRGKGNKRVRVRDLNRGVPLGTFTHGKAVVSWPGLNTNVVEGSKLTERSVVPRDYSDFEKIVEIRDKMGKHKRNRMDPLERGWTGTSMGGRRIGPPDGSYGESFEGFETHVLESKTVSTMDGVLGRKRRMSLFVVTGNGQGSAGFALSKATTLKDALRRAKNRAGQHIVHIERCEDRTIYHDFFTQFHKVKIHVQRKPPGYGLVCHRAIKCICQAIGIKDLYAKIDRRNNNIQNITKAFFLGLLQQKTHQRMAEEKKLHVVKFSPGGFPEIVASPETSPVRTNNEVPKSEELDYSLYTMKGRIIKKITRPEPFYVKLPSYQRFLRRREKSRNHEKIKHQLRYHHDGKLESFYTKDYPECCEYIRTQKKREEGEEEEEEEY